MCLYLEEIVQTERCHQRSLVQIGCITVMEIALPEMK